VIKIYVKAIEAPKRYGSSESKRLDLPIRAESVSRVEQAS
jgi:hypothetical protein